MTPYKQSYLLIILQYRPRSNQVSFPCQDRAAELSLAEASILSCARRLVLKHRRASV